MRTILLIILLLSACGNNTQPQPDAFLSDAQNDLILPHNDTTTTDLNFEGKWKLIWIDVGTYKAKPIRYDVSGNLNLTITPLSNGRYVEYQTGTYTWDNHKYECDYYETLITLDNKGWLRGSYILDTNCSMSIPVNPVGQMRYVLWGGDKLEKILYLEHQGNQIIQVFTFQRY